MYEDDRDEVRAAGSYACDSLPMSTNWILFPQWSRKSQGNGDMVMMPKCPAFTPLLQLEIEGVGIERDRPFEVVDFKCDMVATNDMDRH